MRQRNNRVNQHLSYGFTTINALQLSGFLKTISENIIAIELVGITADREFTKKLKAEYERVNITVNKNFFINAIIFVSVENISVNFTAGLLENSPEIIIIYFSNSSIEFDQVEQNGSDLIKENSDCIVEIMFDEHVMTISFDEKIYSADQITDIIIREGL